ncbi:MAG: tRNA (adenosine(37)-N6)-threonylcarbamoyltransferase complex ATPase subunit type 1 TsaE [Bacteroidaceae bacterium]|nr:tRNA (adenosine(37)-N6)-threonylcarbamoyltransferase complex ATPase subunit type 1 TsaE [Bacteroidaceae bacterium]
MNQIEINGIENINAAAKQFTEFILGQFKKDGRNIFAFYGSMGAGKTTFIKAVCSQLGVEDEVTSPTFAIVNEYTSPVAGSIYHFDFYRVKKMSEAYDMGYEEYFYSDSICFIEWPELIEELLPQETVKVSIEETENGSRVVKF